MTSWHTRGYFVCLWVELTPLCNKRPFLKPRTGKMDKTERVSSSKSLVCLLQALQGRSAVIELRNEITIQGGVYKVDQCMKSVPSHM